MVTALYLNVCLCVIRDSCITIPLFHEYVAIRNEKLCVSFVGDTSRRTLDVLRWGSIRWEQEKSFQEDIYDYVTTSNKQIFMEIACRY